MGGLGGLGQEWKSSHCTSDYTILISEPYEFITYPKKTNKYDVRKSASTAGAFYPWKCS